MSDLIARDQNGTGFDSDPYGNQGPSIQKYNNNTNSIQYHSCILGHVGSGPPTMSLSPQQAPCPPPPSPRPQRKRRRSPPPENGYWVAHHSSEYIVGSTVTITTFPDDPRYPVYSVQELLSNKDGLQPVDVRPIPGTHVHGSAFIPDFPYYLQPQVPRPQHQQQITGNMGIYWQPRMHGMWDFRQQQHHARPRNLLSQSQMLGNWQTQQLVQQYPSTGFVTNSPYYVPVAQELGLGVRNEDQDDVEIKFEHSPTQGFSLFPPQRAEPYTYGEAVTFENANTERLRLFELAEKNAAREQMGLLGRNMMLNDWIGNRSSMDWAESSVGSDVGPDAGLDHGVAMPRFIPGRSVEMRIGASIGTSDEGSSIADAGIDVDASTSTEGGNHVDTGTHDGNENGCAECRAHFVFNVNYGGILEGKEVIQWST
ncbi:hypothetical protein BP6252_12690 [Coleophoma cylindrospora]|uniref:Uncharacterized protein n=1 Tax=Coleophoma cylindrospora TaxID=1849047 RepID=A0A3D8QCM5_9HELO|nr:hypothetical protein BP6252_12690 [Coleophoma cylindrospora]